MQFQKISILRPQKGLEFPWGLGGSVRQKNLKKSMKLNWNFQRDGGGVRKNPFHGGAMELHIQTMREKMLNCKLQDGF